MDTLPAIFQEILRHSETVEQALQLRDENLLHYYSSKLVDHSHLFENLLPRFVGSLCHASILALIEQLNELSEAANRFLNSTLPRSFNGLNIHTAPISGRGRPKCIAPQEVINNLRETGFSWSKIAKLLHISCRTLKRMRIEHNIQDTARQIISDKELDILVTNVKNEHPTAGYVYVWSALKSKGCHVTWSRLKERMRYVDTIGIHLRLRERLQWRKYKVKGANYLWHIDGNEKFVFWHMYNHGCVDGDSRKIIYLGLSHNKKAETVLQFFRKRVSENGLPMRVRGDAVTENYRVCDYMQEIRSETRKPFLVGRSIHNIRIERLWSEVNRIVSRKFRMVFCSLQDLDLLDQNSVLDILCLSHIYFPRIDVSLQNFKESWNNHCLRTEASLTPNQLWLVSMLQQNQSDNNFSSVTSLRDGYEMSPDLSESDDTGNGDIPEFVVPENFVSLISENPELLTEFYNIAQNVVPDPLVEDNNEGTLLYQSLREQVYRDILL